MCAGPNPPPAAAGAPVRAGEDAYLDGPDDLAWFVAISDTHVGA